MILDDTRKFLADEFVVIHGGAKGADAMAAEWAAKNGYPVIEMKAAWTALGHKAGFVRNRWMVDWANPNLVISFPGGVGTADMLKLAKERQIETYVVKL